MNSRESRPFKWSMLVGHHHIGCKEALNSYSHSAEHTIGWCIVSDSTIPLHSSSSNFVLPLFYMEFGRLSLTSLRLLPKFCREKRYSRYNCTSRNWSTLLLHLTVIILSFISQISPWWCRKGIYKPINFLRFRSKSKTSVRKIDTIT